MQVQVQRPAGRLTTPAVLNVEGMQAKGESRDVPAGRLTDARCAPRLLVYLCLHER